MSGSFIIGLIELLAVLSAIAISTGLGVVAVSTGHYFVGVPLLVFGSAIFWLPIVFAARNLVTPLPRRERRKRERQKRRNSRKTSKL